MVVRDGDWTLFDHDFKTGRTVWKLVDEVGTHFRTDYPVDQIIKDNAAARAEMQGQKWGDGKRIASIPLNLFYAEIDEAAKQKDSRYIDRWLNEYSAFRVFG